MLAGCPPTDRCSGFGSSSLGPIFVVQGMTAHDDTQRPFAQVIGGPKPPPMANWPYAAPGQLQSSFAAAAAQQQHRGPPQVCCWLHR